jgi:N-acetylneuraminic acid mutarotase
MTEDWKSLGDSHARGYAGEMLHHEKPLCKITGYVTPKCRVIRTAEYSHRRNKKINYKG